MGSIWKLKKIIREVIMAATIQSIIDFLTEDKKNKVSNDDLILKLRRFKYTQEELDFIEKNIIKKLENKNGNGN